MIPSLIIIGAGGHAKVVADTAALIGWKIDGHTDLDPSMFGSKILDRPILGSDDILSKWDPKSVSLVMGIGVGFNEERDNRQMRSQLFDRLRKEGFEFENIVHPLTAVSDTVKLSVGVFIAAGAVVQANCEIGKNCVINTGALIDHDCTLADHAFIAPGAVLSGGVNVGACALIGAGATILPSLDIGENAIIAAGATVTKPVSAGTIVMGTPASIKLNSLGDN